MVKKGGGKKRKIAIEKIDEKKSLAVACTKRCGGLFSKASQICLLSGAQIAILATPPSSNSHVSFNSFGHSSVDGIVSAFLSGKRPLVPSENNKDMREDIGVCLTRKALGLGFWLEDEAFTRSQNPQELSDAVDSMRKLLKDIKKLRSKDEVYIQLDLEDHDQDDIKNKELKNTDNLVSLHGTHKPDQTLNLQSTTCCIPDDCLNKTNDTEILVLDHDADLPAEFNDNTEEHDQILAVCQSFCDSDNELEMDFDKLIDYDSSFVDDWVYETTH